MPGKVETRRSFISSRRCRQASAVRAYSRRRARGEAQCASRGLCADGPRCGGPREATLQETGEHEPCVPDDCPEREFAPALLDLDLQNSDRISAKLAGEYIAPSWHRT